MVSTADTTGTPSGGPLPWDGLNLEFQVDSIPENGRNIDLELTADQRQHLCRFLDLDDLEYVRCSLDLKPISKHRFSLSGKLAWKAVQTCIVSLEPVVSDYEVNLKVQFWPADSVVRYQASRAETDIDPEEEDEPEQIEAGVINVGRYIYEIISTSINLYPRKEGVEFDWHDAKQSGKDNGALESKPFAALKKLQKNGKQEE